MMLLPTDKYTRQPDVSILTEISPECNIRVAVTKKVFFTEEKRAIIMKECLLSHDVLDSDRESRWQVRDGILTDPDIINYR